MIQTNNSYAYTHALKMIGSINTAFVSTKASWYVWDVMIDISSYITGTPLFQKDSYNYFGIDK